MMIYVLKSNDTVGLSVAIVILLSFDLHHTNQLRSHIPKPQAVVDHRLLIWRRDGHIQRDGFS
jgi:hypothetical protein